MPVIIKKSSDNKLLKPIVSETLYALLNLFITSLTAKETPFVSNTTCPPPLLYTNGSLELVFLSTGNQYHTHYHEQEYQPFHHLLLAESYDDDMPVSMTALN